MIQQQLAVRLAQPGDQNRIANLIYFEPYVHRHLDWRAPLDWLGVSEYWLTEQNGRITAALACPPDPPGIAWLRLFARVSASPLTSTWVPLWDCAQNQFARQSITVAAIVMQDWMRHLLEDSQFHLAETILMLEHPLDDLKPCALPPGLALTPMTWDDLPDVARVDELAFAPLWRNSLEALHHAFRQAGIASIAHYDGQIVGYQISTFSAGGAHLARLAVNPACQGRGTGYALVRHLLESARAHGLRRVTVNTQASNQASLSLYQKTGFTRTGEQYPVYIHP